MDEEQRGRVEELAQQRKQVQMAEILDQPQDGMAR